MRGYLLRVHVTKWRQVVRPRHIRLLLLRLHLLGSKWERVRARRMPYNTRRWHG